MEKRKTVCFWIVILLIGCWGCVTSPDNLPEAKTELMFADPGWDSVKLNNAVAGLIAESVFGYTWKETPGSTPISHEAVVKGDVDVHMEEWTNNIASYTKDRDDGKLTELGVNFDDNHQGLYIPRYIADKYPELRTVKDLKDYAWLFPDPEDPSKGIIYGGVTGWELTETMSKKLKAYGLDRFYNYLESGSDSILTASMTSAWDKKAPIIATYFDPTWILGKYDFVLLADDPYNKETFQDGIGAFPSVKVTIAVSNAFAASNPEYCAFLGKYRMPSAVISEALAYMNDSGADYKTVARWLLMESHPEFVREWLTDEQAKRFLNHMNGSDEDSKSLSSFLFDFPTLIHLDTAVIDDGVRKFAVHAAVVLNAIKGFLNGIVLAFNQLLEIIIWPVFILLIFLLGWKSRRRIRSGVLYATLMFLIGAFGLWDLMKTTLSVVLASVLLSLIVGIPIGVLISQSERSNHIIRPLLDTMQTMPVFVYLIPALLLFGTGNASGVIATVVYAVVPVIRLTSLGIRQVDKEVVEASNAFGSTKWQTLRKVQIPLAMPTIMTGINQTLMMAVSMVVTTSMIGVRGLGMEVLNAVNRIEMGRGLIAGSCIVILAIVLDRLTQGFAKGAKENLQEGNHA